jgi:hypothetical protein
MSLMIVAVAGAVLVLAVGVWAWISREGTDAQRDMGTISGQWINEHRSQERQSNDR